MELYLTSGYVRYSQDNSYKGGGLVYGGTFTFPLDSGFAIEAEAHTNRTTFRSDNLTAGTTQWPDLRRRVNFYSAGAAFRLGSEKVCGFFAAGPAMYTDGEEQSRIVVNVRVGAVFSLAEHTVLRVEAFGSSFDKSAAVTGAKFGIGYKF